jgi:hypothetical protein
MKLSIVIASLAALLLTAFVAFGADQPEMPQPTKEHEWLKKFAGEWNTVTEIYMEPGKPPMKATGTETAKMLGGFWVVGENKGEMMGAPFTGMMTFGYDPQKKKYVGTWVDSNTSMLWQYLGTVDGSGRILTLETEGFCPMEGKVCQFRDTIEFKSDDQRVMTGERQSTDGKWTKMMTVTATRKKAD